MPKKYCTCADMPPGDLHNRCIECGKPINPSRTETRDIVEHDEGLVQPGDDDWLEEYSRSDADPGL